MKIFIALLCITAGLFALERFTRADRQASEAKVIAARQAELAAKAEATMAAAVKNKTPLAGMTYEDAAKIYGSLQFQSESDGTGGKIQTYFHNDGSFTTTLFFVNGRLSRWSKVSNF